LVKLELSHLGKSPLWAVEIGTEIHAGRELLEQSLQAIANSVPPDEFSSASVG